MVGPGTNLWTADGNFGTTADGFPGWFADGYEATPLFFATTDFAGVGVNIGALTYVYSFVQSGWVVTGYPPLLGVDPPGSYQNLVISNGPAPPAVTATVPNVLGEYYYQAQLDLLQARCLIDLPTFVNAPGVVPGIVTGQSLPGGTVVPDQTRITLTVSGFLVTMQGGLVVPVP